MVGVHLVPMLQTFCFGKNQRAFTPGLSARDLVSMLMMSWILAICHCKKIGCFLIDISGAFDRVFKAYLFAKLQHFGVGVAFLNFVDAYLSPRTGQVVVQGQRSCNMELSNFVLKGSVNGPTLWNACFSDVSVSAASMGGQEAMFADDLNIFKEFDQHVPLKQVTEDSQKCRSKVHKWSATSRVSFDPSTELMIVLYRSRGHEAPFKLLGCMVDTDLRMHSCIDHLLSKIRPKITAILRTRGFYRIPDLITQFKAHIWGLMEMNIGGYFHAASPLLAKLDHAQN